MTALSRVCHACSTRWPNGKDYESCPECSRSTTISPLVSIDDALAHSRLTHARFERWLDEHGRRGPEEQLERIPVRDRA